jgi:hypothetical protein
VLVDPERGFAGVIERVNELAELIPNSHVLNQVSLFWLLSFDNKGLGRLILVGQNKVRLH